MRTRRRSFPWRRSWAASKHHPSHYNGRGQTIKTPPPIEGENNGEKNLFDLSGRVALITGASSHGIGNESAKLLASYGAKVFLTARREDKLQEAVAEIEAVGGEAAYAVCDVSQEEDCKAAVEACVETFGRLDIMVLAAGISGLSLSGGLEAAFDVETGSASRVSTLTACSIW